MKRRAIGGSLRVSLAIGIFFLPAMTGTAHAQRRAPMTTHVPDEVSSGLAPLVGRLPANQRVSLAISLPLKNQTELESFLADLYDPRSPNFRHYLSVEEFAEKFGPSEEDYAALQRFAQANGLRIVEKMSNRMVLDVEAPAANIESAFHVTMGVFQHPTEARTFFSADREPTVEADVPILHITGLDDFVLPQAKNFISPDAVSKNAKGSGPGGSFLGSDLRMAYYGTGSLNGAGQKVAIYALKGFNMTDINTYFGNAHQGLNVPIKAVSVNGASTTCGTGCSDAEQCLDIEQAISMAPGLTQLLFYVGKNDISILNQMASDNSAKSISISYGWKKDQSSLDPVLEEMAAQGQSVFVATGDQGSGTAANVVWPSDDAWVTAVGGTVLTAKTAGGGWQSETGWVHSAGMVSKNGVAIPSYQLLAGVITATNHGSKTLRNIPDVSSESNASQYICSDGSCRNFGGGTSYAAPLWASLIAMANQQAASRGDANIGFLNPIIYDIGTGSTFGSNIHDITSGNNGGFNAVGGFDLVTGWGSPQGVNLINALAP
ncbi:MAG TPA: S53 family peptidase [Candidatus Sulfotelmatobacter sp.]|jgi:subtilase family serine protease|nr:S53 family peptidase [Candidatus Sulfotelmatobacter sp.]